MRIQIGRFRKLPHPKIRIGQRLGKYKIRRRLASGGFGDVYDALDTIEGVSVALKIPNGVNDLTFGDFLREIQITGRLEHPNILPIKNADIIDEVLLISYPLGERSLADRLQKRISLANALFYTQQMLEGLSYAHQKNIIHCDVKPENLILFADGRLRLGDFGIAKVGMHTLFASNSGTSGYIAPEQAMGRPSPRSDVFSAGLVIYRMLAGCVPAWPFEWPLSGYDRLCRYAPSLVRFVRTALSVYAQNRYSDATAMLDAFVKIAPAALRYDLQNKNHQQKVITSK